MGLLSAWSVSGPDAPGSHTRDTDPPALKGPSKYIQSPQLHQWHQTERHLPQKGSKIKTRWKNLIGAAKCERPALTCKMQMKAAFLKTAGISPASWEF